MNIIALVGFKSSGKNTAAEALFPFNYVSFSYADSLKDSLASIFCWDRQMLEGITQESRVWREQVDEWWAQKLGIPNFTPRFAMQTFGTEVMRKHFNNDIWVYNIERRIDMIKGRNVVITDARFPNEIDVAKRRSGAVIRIKRGPDPEWYETARMANNGSMYHQTVMEALGIHASERAWIGYPVDRIIENDASVEQLHERLRNFIGQK